VDIVRTDVSEEPGQLLVAACVVPSSQIFVTLMKEAPGSSETSVLTRTTRRNNPEDTILHSHRRENLKSYIIHLFNIIDILGNIIIGFISVNTVFMMFGQKHTAWTSSNSEISLRHLMENDLTMVLS
jgi:hypothetical protein